MGRRTHFKCDKCNYKFHTSGPWEFRWNESGDKQYCGHPLPLKEAKKGVDGLSASLYCNNCDDVFDIIMIEFKNRVHNDIWGSNNDLKEGYSYDDYKNILNANTYGFGKKFTYDSPNKKTKCPKCGKRRELLLYAITSFQMECPRCEEGNVKVGRIDHS